MLFLSFALMISAPEIIGIIGIIVMIFCLICFISNWISSSKEQRKAVEEMDEDIPEPVFVKARAVAKSAELEFEGYRVVHTELCFTVTFETEHGERIVLEVPEEVYNRITKDQEGMLMTVNGLFHDFGYGEDIDPQQE